MKISEKRLQAYLTQNKKAKETVNTAEAPEGFLKSSREEKVEKIAKYLLVIGKDEASPILKHLPEDMVEEILKRVTQIDRIDRIESEKILKEFNILKIKPERARGGPDTARSMLAAAFGEDKADSILGKVVPESVEKPFRFLDDVDAVNLISILQTEPVPVISIIFNYLKPPVAAKVLKSYSKEDQKKIIQRIALVKKVDREVLIEIEQKLKDRIKNSGKEKTIEINGPNVLANILKYMDLGDEKRLLDELAEEDEQLSRHVRDQLFTMDTIVHIKDTDLQKVLDNFDEKYLAVLLRAKNEEVVKKIRENISGRRLLIIDEENEIVGPVRISEVNRLTKEFLNFLKEKEESGEITIVREDEELL